MKRVLPILFLVLLIATTQAQEDTTASTPKENSYDWQKIRQRITFGGGLGAGYNFGYTIINFSPNIGYRITDNWVAGAGFLYQGAFARGDNFSIYGPQVFTRYQLLPMLFATAQYERINFDDPFLPGRRKWNDAILAGIGYGGRGFNLSLFANLLSNSDSEYLYPSMFYVGRVGFFIRGGFFF